MNSFRKPGVTSSFSLVEVIMALGITSFALVSLLALLTISFNAGLTAKQETAIAGMSRHVLADLTQKPFHLLTNSSYSYYFDSEGNSLPSSSAALFRCVASCSSTVIGNPMLTNLTSVQMSFQWPASAPTNFQTRILNATVANLH